MENFKFISEYASMGDGTKTAKQRVLELGQEVASLLETVQNTPEVGTHSEFVEAFRNWWILGHLEMWRGFVFAPRERPHSEAAMLLWDVLKIRVLAGFEMMLQYDMESRKRAFEPEIDELVKDLKTRLGELTPQQLDIAREGAGQELATQLLVQEEDLLKNTQEALDGLDAGLHQVLANTSPEQSVSVDKGVRGDQVLSALCRRAPITCAVAWRFVLELQRSRKWHDGSVADELTRLSSDQTTRMLRCWEGLVWVASGLWRSQRQLIERQAKLEGKLDRKQAELNTKKHLYVLQHFLDSEIDAVAEIRLTARL